MVCGAWRGARVRVREWSRPVQQRQRRQGFDVIFEANLIVFLSSQNHKITASPPTLSSPLLPPTPNPHLHPRSLARSSSRLLPFPPPPPNAVPSSEFLEVQRLRPGSLFPPLRGLHRVLLLTPRELDCDRAIAAATNPPEPRSVEVRPDFGEGL